MNSKVGNNMNGLKPGTLLLLTLCCCLLLGNLYYSQPILAKIAAALTMTLFEEDYKDIGEDISVGISGALYAIKTFAPAMLV